MDDRSVVSTPARERVLAVLLETRTYVARPSVSALFAPTGDLQELSLRSGWGDELLRVAGAFDVAWAALCAEVGAVP